MSMVFPDGEVMKRIKAAFEADPRITSDYKKSVRVSYSGRDYIVIANSIKFVAMSDCGDWQFRNVGLAN